MDEWMDELITGQDEVAELRWQLAIRDNRIEQQRQEIARLKREQWQMVGIFLIFCVVVTAYIVWVG